MGKEMATSAGLSYGAVNSIAERLSAMPELYLPHSTFPDHTNVTQQEKKDHLVSLLHRDAAVFLERYGKSLELHEIGEFEGLRGDYEINWHVKQLKTALSPSPKEQKARAATVKNRRLAFMEKLVEDGQYFSEEAMRMRCPLLHHEYIGKFQDVFTWAASRRGDKLADILIRQSDEALIQRKLEEERKMAEEREEEEEEEDEDEDSEQYIQEVNALSCMQLSEEMGPSSSVQQNMPERQQNMRPEERLEEFTRSMMEKFMSEEVKDKPKLTEEEMEDKLEDFTRVMQEKFLSGEDGEHVDYARIDGDSALDDHWLREVSWDAEEKYFQED